MVQTLGRWFEGLIQPLVDVFTMPGIGGILALAILIFSLLLFCWTLVWWWRGRQEIRSASDIIALASGDTEAARRSTFTTYYEEIDEKLDALPRLGACWREFRETLERPDIADPDAGAAFVRNEKRPQTYFTLANAGLSASVLRSMPGVLVGTGLVLTFIGLIAALGVAANGLSGSVDQDTMKDVLKSLLSTAGAKFYASATALGCSIVLGFVQRNLLSRLARSIHRFNDALEERLLFDAMASTSRRQLRVMEEQREQLRTFNQDFALDVGNAVKQAFSESNGEIGAHLEAVAQKLDALADRTSANVAQAVGDRFDNALSDTLTKMDGTLNKVAGSLGALPDQIENAVASLGNTSEEMNRRLLAGADDSAAEAGQRMATEMGGAVHALSNAIAAIENAGQGVGTRTVEAGNAMAERMESVGNVAASALNDEADRLTGQLRDVVAPLEGGVDAMARAAETLNAEMAELAGRIEGLRAALTEGVEAHRAVASEVDDVRSGLAEVVAGSRSVANDNRSALAENGKAAAQLTVASTSLTEGLETIRDATDDAQEQRERLSELLERSAADLERHVARYDGMDEKFAVVFERFNEAMADQQRKLQSHVGEIDSKFVGAIDNLTSLVEEIGDTVREARSIPEAAE